VAKRELDVYIDLDGEPVRLGQAWFTQRRGGPVSSVFAYSATFLARRDAIAIDPNLELVTGNQYVDGLPGAFQDCAPDRWGRNLIDKRHRRSDSSARRASLNDVDYLVEVSDRTAAVKDLLDAGSGSLGGARPKASILDNDGTLLIAKLARLSRDRRADHQLWFECIARSCRAVPSRRVQRGRAQHR